MSPLFLLSRYVSSCSMHLFLHLNFLGSLVTVIEVAFLSPLHSFLLFIAVLLSLLRMKVYSWRLNPSPPSTDISILNDSRRVEWSESYKICHDS